ncbi:MAG TPA: SDR family oxidoreductase [Devosia sp.]|nr:SDR family oxidoreductase [Devosia sp.]
MPDNSPFRLDGKQVLVTGAGGGIGHALVAAFRTAGARVSGADRGNVPLSALALEHELVTDLGDVAATHRAVRSYLDSHGTPDVVVSNAGYTRAETLENLDVDVWQSELAVNLSGAYALTAPIVDAMAARGSGAVIFISSVNGLAHYGNPAYSAAKAGLIAYAKAIAVERGSRGIRANVVCPGSVRTPAWDHRLAADPGLLAKVLPHYPLGRLVTPEEVANAVVFLASPAAAGITGIAMAVDAGLTAGNLRFIDDVLRG